MFVWIKDLALKNDLLFLVTGGLLYSFDLSESDLERIQNRGVFVGSAVNQPVFFVHSGNTVAFYYLDIAWIQGNSAHLKPDVISTSVFSVYKKLFDAIVAVFEICEFYLELEAVRHVKGRVSVGLCHIKKLTRSKQIAIVHIVIGDDLICVYALRDKVSQPLLKE